MEKEIHHAHTQKNSLYVPTSQYNYPVPTGSKHEIKMLPAFNTKLSLTNELQHPSSFIIIN